MAFFISLEQIYIMFILMAIGFLYRKKGMIHEETGKDLTAILVYIVGPCLVINAFERPASASLVKDFSLTFLAGSLNYLFPIAFSSLLLSLPCLKKTRTSSCYSSPLNKKATFCQEDCSPFYKKY